MSVCAHKVNETVKGNHTDKSRHIEGGRFMCLIFIQSCTCNIFNFKGVVNLF